MPLGLQYSAEIVDVAVLWFTFLILSFFLGYLVQDTSSFKTDEAYLMFKNDVNFVF